MPAPAEYKQTNRDIILEWRSQGAPKAAADIERITRELLRQKGISVSSSEAMDRFQKALQQVAKSASTAGDRMGRFGKDTSNAGMAVNGLQGMLGSLGSAFTSLLNPINAFGGALGAGGLSITGIIETGRKLNTELLRGSGAWAKYGVGTKKFENSVSGISKQLKLTQIETMGLMKTFEKTFNQVTLGNAADLFKNIRNAVGSNSEAMQDMASALGGIVEKFPDLERSITRLNSSDKQRLSLTNQMMVLNGQMSLSQSKQFQDYIQQNAQAGAADDKRKRQAEQQIEILQEIKMAFEEIAKAINEELMPYIEIGVKWVLKFKDSIIGWAKPIAGAVVGFVVLKTALGVISGLVSSIGMGMRGWKLLSSVSGIKAAKSTITVPGKRSKSKRRGLRGAVRKMGLRLRGAGRGMGLSRAGRAIGSAKSGVSVLGRGIGAVGGGLARLLGPLAAGATAALSIGSAFDFLAEKIFNIKPENQSTGAKTMKAGSMIAGGAVAGGAVGAMFGGVLAPVGAALGALGGAAAAFFTTNETGKKAWHVITHYGKQAFGALSSFAKTVGSYAMSVFSKMGNAISGFGEWSGISGFIDKMYQSVVATEKAANEGAAQKIKDDPMYKQFGDRNNNLASEFSTEKEKAKAAGDTTDEAAQAALSKVIAFDKQKAEHLVARTQSGDGSDAFGDDKGKLILDESSKAQSEALEFLQESYENAASENDETSKQYFDALKKRMEAEIELSEMLLKKTTGQADDGDVEEKRKALEDAKKQYEPANEKYDMRRNAAMGDVELSTTMENNRQKGQEAGEMKGLQSRGAMMSGNYVNAFKIQEDARAELKKLDTQFAMKDGKNIQSSFAGDDKEANADRSDLIKFGINNDSASLSNEISLSEASVSERSADIAKIAKQKESAQLQMSVGSEQEQLAAKMKYVRLEELEKKLKSDLNKATSQRGEKEAQVSAINGHVLSQLNEQKLILDSQNKLYEAQSGYLDAIAGSMATSGNIDKFELSKGIEDTVMALRKKNESMLSSLEITKQMQQGERQAFMNNDKYKEALEKSGMSADQFITGEITPAKAAEVTKNLNAAFAEATNKPNASKDDKKSAEDILDVLQRVGEASISINILDAERLNSEKAIKDELRQQVELRIKAVNEAYKGQLDFASAIVEKMELQVQLADATGAGLRASVDQRMASVEAIDKEIALQQSLLEMQRDQYEKAKISGTQEDIIRHQTEILNIENKITGNKLKQANMLKTIREGYVSAITAMTAGTGMFSKIMIDQNRNMGTGVRYMNVLQSKSSGGTSGGMTTPAGEFTPNGMTFNTEQQRGYKLGQGVGGEYSNEGISTDAQARQLDAALQRGRNGTMFGGNAQLISSEIGEAAEGAPRTIEPNEKVPNQTPSSAWERLKPKPDENADRPSTPNAAAQPANAQSQGQSIVLLGSIDSKHATTIEVLRGIKEGIDALQTAGTASVAGARDGGIIGRFHEGGAVGKINGFVDGGQPEKGDRHHIMVADGEVIMNQRQWPRVAAAAGMSSGEFADMVKSKDYSRLSKTGKARDGNIVGRYAEGGMVGSPMGPPTPDSMASKAGLPSGSIPTENISQEERFKKSEEIVKNMFVKKADQESLYFSSNDDLPKPSKFNDDGSPLDNKGKVIARKGWQYIKDGKLWNGKKWETVDRKIDGTRWYSPEEIAVIISKISYDWNNKRVIDDKKGDSAAYSKMFGVGEDVSLVMNDAAVKSRQNASTPAPAEDVPAAAPPGSPPAASVPAAAPPGAAPAEAVPAGASPSDTPAASSTGASLVTAEKDILSEDEMVQHEYSIKAYPEEYKKLLNTDYYPDERLSIPFYGSRVSRKIKEMRALRGIESSIPHPDNLSGNYSQRIKTRKSLIDMGRKYHAIKTKYDEQKAITERAEKRKQEEWLRDSIMESEKQQKMEMDSYHSKLAETGPREPTVQDQLLRELMGNEPILSNKQHTEMTKEHEKFMDSHPLASSSTFKNEVSKTLEQMNGGDNYRDGGFVGLPRFSNGGIVPNQASAVGDRTLSLLSPREEVLPESSPRHRKNIESESSSGGSKVDLHVHNSFNINYSELGKVPGLVKGKIDDAMNKLMREMSGSGSTLPR